jgi:hypothetical protein
MVNKTLIGILLCGLFAIMAPSCKKYYAGDSTDNEISDDTPGAEEVSDYVWDNSLVINILLNGTSISSDGAGVEIVGSKATITSAGTYNISGKLTNGQIIVDTKDDQIVRLILNTVDITCSNSSPLYIKDAAKTLIVLADNSLNNLTDGSSYTLNSDGEPNAALFSKSYLSFCGNGALTVTANFQDGITGKDGLLIKSGTLNVTAADDGIRGKDFLILRRGKITVNAKGDGLKSDNDTDASLGYISIDSAVVNVTSTGDGFNAKTGLKINDGSYTVTSGGGITGNSNGYNGTISKKALKASGDMTIGKGTFILNSADDAIHSNTNVTINDGTFSISAGDDAIHAETSITFNGGALNISKSYEGIESATITINNGSISLVSTDDAFNATKGLTQGGGEANDGSVLTINGGYVYVNTTSGDGLDSNGNLSITGGTIVVMGPQSQPEVSFDINGTFNISGGFLIGTGPNSGNMIEGPSITSSQYSVKVTMSSTLSSATLFHLQNADGKDLLTFKPVRSVYYVVFSSSELISGANYSVYTGGSSTGTTSNGLYSGGVYTGGTLKKTFALTSKLTSVSF